MSEEMDGLGGWVSRWMDGWMDGLMDGWGDREMNGWVALDEVVFPSVAWRL